MAKKIWNVEYSDLKDSGTTSFTTRGKALKYAVEEEIASVLQENPYRIWLTFTPQEVRESMRHHDDNVVKIAVELTKAAQKKDYEKALELFQSLNAESTGWTYITVEESELH